MNNHSGSKHKQICKPRDRVDECELQRARLSSSSVTTREDETPLLSETTAGRRKLDTTGAKCVTAQPWFSVVKIVLETVNNDNRKGLFFVFML